MTTPNQTFAGDGSRELDGIHVRYGDLDLSNQRDLQVLYARINRAAQALCGSAAHRGGRVSLIDHCIDQTVGDAVTQINKLQLTALYRERTRHLGG